jgi:hypothetical protein
VAEHLSVSPLTVSERRRRFIQARLEGLVNAREPGRGSHGRCVSRRSGDYAPPGVDAEQSDPLGIHAR